MEPVTSVQNYFDTLDKRFVASAAKGIDAVFQYELAGSDGGTWHVIVKDGAFQLVTGAHAAPTSTIKMKSDDYVKMINGQLSGTMAFMKGLLKVAGNVMMAQKMQAVFPPNK